TNIPVRAVSDITAVTALRFEPTNPPPLFARLTEWDFSNTSTNGVAAATLSLSPTFDAAGVYTLTLRADTLTTNITTNITVTVLDNPGLLVTRWVGSTNGNWSTASRWSAGRPDPTRIAVIDQPGTYQVTFDTNTTVAGLVVGGNSGAQTLLFNTGITLTNN